MEAGRSRKLLTSGIKSCRIQIGLRFVGPVQLVSARVCKGGCVPPLRLQFRFHFLRCINLGRTGIIVKSIQFFLSQKFKSRTSIKNLIKYIVARYIEDYASINYSREKWMK